jgi:hypothetical protein
LIECVLDDACRELNDGVEVMASVAVSVRGMLDAEAQ